MTSQMLHSFSFVTIHQFMPYELYVLAPGYWRHLHSCHLNIWQFDIDVPEGKQTSCQTCQLTYRLLVGRISLHGFIIGWSAAKRHPFLSYKFGCHAIFIQVIEIITSELDQIRRLLPQHSDCEILQDVSQTCRYFEVHLDAVDAQVST